MAKLTILNDENILKKVAAESPTLNAQQQQMNDPNGGYGLQDKEVNFKQQFEQMAHEHFLSKAKKFANYVREFVVIEVDPEQNYGFGVFKLNLGEKEDELFVPIVMTNSTIKPVTLMYNEKFDMLPFNTEWVDYIKESRPERVVDEQSNEDFTQNERDQYNGVFAPQTKQQGIAPVGANDISMDGVMIPPVINKSRTLLPGSMMYDVDNPLVSQNYRSIANPQLTSFNSLLPKLAAEKDMSKNIQDFESNFDKTAATINAYREELIDRMVDESNSDDKGEYKAFLKQAFLVKESVEKINLDSIKSVEKQLAGAKQQLKTKKKEKPLSEAYIEDEDVREAVDIDKHIVNQAKHNLYGQTDDYYNVGSDLARLSAQNAGGKSLLLNYINAQAQQDAMGRKKKVKRITSSAQQKRQSDAYMANLIRMQAMGVPMKMDVNMPQYRFPKAASVYDNFSKLAGLGDEVIDAIVDHGFYIDNPNDIITEPTYLMKTAGLNQMSFPGVGFWRGYVMSIDGKKSAASLFIAESENGGPISSRENGYYAELSAAGSADTAERETKDGEEKLKYFGLIDGKFYTGISKRVGMLDAEEIDSEKFTKKIISELGQKKLPSKGEKNGLRSKTGASNHNLFCGIIANETDSILLVRHINDITTVKTLGKGNDFTLNKTYSYEAPFTLLNGEIVMEDELTISKKKVSMKDFSGKIKAMKFSKKGFYSIEHAFVTEDVGLGEIARLLYKAISKSPMMKVASITSHFGNYYIEEDKEFYSDKELFLKLANLGFSNGAVETVLKDIKEDRDGVILTYPNLEKIEELQFDKVAMYRELKDKLDPRENSVLRKCAADLSELGADVKSKYTSSLSGLINLAALNMEDDSLQQTMTQYIPELVKGLNLVGRVSLIFQLSENELIKKWGVEKVKNLQDNFNKILKSLSAAVIEVDNQVRSLSL